MTRQAKRPAASRYVRLRGYKTYPLLSRDYRIIPAFDDSLAGIDIRSGDLLVLAKSASSPQGGLAIVRTPDGYLMRFYFREGERVRLESANPDYPTRRYKADEVSVFGRVLTEENSQNPRRKHAKTS